MFQFISLLIIALLTAIDRITKVVIVNTVKVNGPVSFLFGAFQLRYTENTGAAFSSFSDNTVVLSVFTVLVIILCLFVLLTRRVKSKFANACLILIISGGIGNAIDRIFNGFVVDFIEPLFMDFAVFNFADCCITVGAFLLIGYELYELVNEKKHNKEQSEAEEKAKTDD